MIYAIFVCAAASGPNGPCSMVQGPFDNVAVCEKTLEEFAQARHESLKDGTVYGKGEVFVCLKRPA